MTSVLIDNATLTAVQRITGQVSSRSRDSVDIDLAAFENFVQARLFYDDVLSVDNYLPRFRVERMAAFPTVRFLDKNSFGLTAAHEIAAKESSQIRPKIQGGSFANPEFQSLFELLQSHMICTWDISSSVYHLTLKVLAEEGSAEFQKYGAVATAIFSELSDANRSGERREKALELVDSKGQPIRRGYRVEGAKWGSGEGATGDLSTALTSFVAALVWLAERSIYYSLAAATLKADSFIFPVRQAYQQKFIASRLNYGDDFPKRMVAAFAQTLARDAADVVSLSGTTATSCDFPIFSAWLTVDSGHPAAALVAAEELRNRDEFREARALLSKLRSYFDDEDIKSANAKLRRELEGLSKLSKHMRSKYSIETNQGAPLTRLISIYNNAASVFSLPAIPEIDLGIALPSFIGDFRHRKGFSAIYRNAMEDLSTFATLGRVRTELAKRVVVNDDPAWRPKAEAPRYRYSHSPFKSPM